MKSYFFSVLSCCFLCLFSATAYSQHAHHHELNDHHHDHNDWELGAAFGVVPFMDHDEIAPAMHFHLLKKIPYIDGLMMGIGGETVIDEHMHFNAGIVFNYTLFAGLHAAVSPGVIWLKHDEDWESGFITHLELSYEFEVGKIHIGPIVEYSLSKLDKHLMFGVHVGFGL